jgi:hypothetical protein
MDRKSSIYRVFQVKRPTRNLYSNLMVGHREEGRVSLFPLIALNFFGTNFNLLAQAVMKRYEKRENAKLTVFLPALKFHFDSLKTLTNTMRISVNQFSKDW